MERREGEDLDAFMARSLEACLAELDAPDVVSDHKVQSPDLSFEPISLPDMVEDPLNSSAVGSDTRHVARTAPDQAARERNQVYPENFWDVPITPARPTGEIDAKQTVIHNVGATDAAFAQFLSVVRSANASSKRSGQLASSIAYTLGSDGATITEGSPLGVATRITSARLAAEQGATASAQPADFAFDAHWARLSDIGAAEDAHPDAFAVYMPSGLSPGAMSALASLLVEGGPSAYTWRYRPQVTRHPPPGREGAGGAGDQEADPDGDHQEDEPPEPEVEVVPDPRQDFMPSVTRHLFPGGFNDILIVTEKDVLLPAVGGHSLTVPNLEALERFYRKYWGNEVFDAAWKTTAASAAVYTEPVVDPDKGDFNLGENFDLRRASHIVNGHDMQGPEFTWTGPQTPHQPGGDVAFPTDAIDSTRRGTSREIHDIVWRLMRQWDPQLPPRFTEAMLDATGARFNYRPPGAQQDDVADVVWADLFRQDLRRLSERARRLFRAAYLACTDMSMPMGLEVEPDVQGDPIDEDTPIRNVFGARDHARMHLPLLKMHEAVGLIANYTRPARRAASHSSFTRPRRKARLSNYAAHLHLSVFFAYVRSDVWPCDLKTFARMHSGYMRRVSPALRPYCWMDQLAPDYYPEQNWLVLESSFMIRNANADVPFVGTLVPGTWPSRTDGIVKLTDPTVNFAAVEAAFRNAVNDFGTVTADARFGGTTFTIVRGNDGRIHALGFAPRIDTPRGTAGVELHADTGINTFQPGSNVTAPILTVM